MSYKVNFALLASEWGSKHGGLSTLNRVLAIELAKHSKVHVSVFVPRCDQQEIDEARNNNITLVQAARVPCFDEKDWLCYPPEDLQIDIVIGHGVKLGRQAQIIRKNRGCKWIQFVHTDPEELGMFKRYSDPIAKGETKHQMEVELCVLADSVVAVGPKLADAYRSYLRSYKKDQKVFVLTPGIFSEFSGVEQATQDGGKCRVLAFGRGDSEDFSLKGFDIAAKAVGKLKNANLIFVGACNKQQDNVADNLKQCDIPPARLRVRTFLESRQDLKNQLCEVDLAIMPSRTEGFGLAALEALSAGLPILASGNSGFGEALSKVPFGSGCVIHSDDPMVWADEIEKVWEKDREIRLDESGKLRTAYAKKYNWETQCKDLVREITRSTVADESHLKRKASSSITKDTKDQDAEEPAPKLRKLTSRSGAQDPGQATPVAAERTDGPAQRTRRRSSTQDPPPKATTRVRKVKIIKLINKDLERLSKKIGTDWKPLGRELEIDEPKLVKYDKENDEYDEKAYKMLLHWKQREGSAATFQVLFDALTGEMVDRKDLGEKICLSAKDSP